MVNIDVKISAKTKVNGREFEFLFHNNVDIKDTTQALANIHQNLIDFAKEQQEKAEAAKKEEIEKTDEPLEEDNVEAKVDEI